MLVFRVVADVTATVMTFADHEVEREKIYGLNVKKSVVSLESSYRFTPHNNTINVYFKM